MTSARLLTNVAYVINSFPEPSETFIADEAVSLTSQNVRPFVLHLREGDRAVVHPAAQELLDSGRLCRLDTVTTAQKLATFARLFFRAPSRTLRALRASRKHPERWRAMQAMVAADWCLRHGVQFVHAHFADVNFMYAAAISAWSGIPYGVTTHRYDILDDPLEPDLARDLYRSASAVVTISEFNRELMAEKYSLPRQDIHVVRCGIELSRFQYVERDLLASGVLRIVNVGRLAAMKGHDVLLAALEIVRSRGVPFSLEIIGGGSLQATLAEQASAAGLSECVTFHGAQPESFVRERLATADLFVLSSRSEGLPVACIEALAMGTPVIATRIFGIPELIEDGVNGMLVPPDDASALADAICSAYSSPQRLLAMSKAGRVAVEARFERDSCTRQLISVWSQAVARAAQ